MWPADKESIRRRTAVVLLLLLPSTALFSHLPPPPPFYGTFFPSPSSFQNQNPSPPSAPIYQPPPVPSRQPPLPPYHVVQVGYQSYLYPVVAECTPVIVKSERATAASMPRRRHRLGMAALAAIAVILGMSSNNPLW